jgi:hypothetical protein
MNIITYNVSSGSDHLAKLHARQCFKLHKRAAILECCTEFIACTCKISAPLTLLSIKYYIKICIHIVIHYFHKHDVQFTEKITSEVEKMLERSSQRKDTELYNRL